ncbi:hypothetical protein NMG60_11016416 [Bertholletia excelsa]
MDIIPSHSLLLQEVLAKMPTMQIWSRSRRVSYPLSEEQLKGLLKRYDTNGDGRLSKKELKVAFHDFGLRFCGWKARQALCHADADGDGYISDEEWDELVKYASKKWRVYVS